MLRCGQIQAAALNYIIVWLWSHNIACYQYVISMASIELGPCCSYNVFHETKRCESSNR